MGYRIDLLLSLGARFLEEPILTLASTKLISTTLSGFLGHFLLVIKGSMRMLAPTVPI